MYQNPEPNDEMLECFDAQGQVVEPHTRQEIHAESLQYWHGVVNVWLVNSSFELLCSKRAADLKGSPGKWQTYFGGHVKAGFNFTAAAALELDEEIGLSIDYSKLYLIDAGKNESSRHFYESYAYLFEGNEKDLVFNDGEITEVKWLTMEEYWQQKQLNPDQWCNSCGLENQKKIKHVLA